MSPEVVPADDHLDTVLSIRAASIAVDSAEAPERWKQAQRELLRQLEVVVARTVPTILPIEGQWADVTDVPERWQIRIDDGTSANPFLDEFTFEPAWDAILSRAVVLSVARTPEHAPRGVSPIDRKEHPLWRLGAAYLSPAELADLQLEANESGISRRPGFFDVYAVVEKTRGLQSLVRLIDKKAFADRLATADAVFTEGERRALMLDMEDLRGTKQDAVFCCRSRHPDYRGRQLIVERALIADLLVPANAGAVDPDPLFPIEPEVVDLSRYTGVRAEVLWRIRDPTPRDRALFPDQVHEAVWKP